MWGVVREDAVREFSSGVWIVWRAGGCARSGGWAVWAVEWGLKWEFRVLEAGGGLSWWSLRSVGW